MAEEPPFDEPSYIKETLIGESEDVLKRGKLTTIHGYTDLFFDKKYIRLMHTYLCHQLEMLETYILKAVRVMEDDGDGVWDKVFLGDARDFSSKTLRTARENIIQYQNCVIHSLSTDAVACVLNLQDFGRRWANCVTAIVYKFCRATKFRLTIEPILCHNAFYFRLAIDDRDPLQIFLENRFGD